ncbi:hypothetical protein [Streptomyces sp. NPDC059708]|uniref:hypothetical protein n=1 Tax=Streptomyces sp. NPDC059708 TaxID=3346916 RepID=UPI0036976992
MRTLADSPGRAEDWTVDMLCTLYADHGRAADGRLDEAIRLAGRHPEGDIWAAAWTLSELLAEAGRTEDAVRLLQRREPEPFVPMWSGPLAS